MKKSLLLMSLILVVLVAGCVKEEVSAGTTAQTEGKTEDSAKTSSVKNTEMLQTTNPIKITIKDVDLWNPHLYENYIAVSNPFDGNQKDVYLYDIINQKLEQITKDLSDQEVVDISNNKILYRDYRFVGNTGELPLNMLYDITSKLTESLDINKSLGSNEKISNAIGLTKDFAIFIVYSETLDESFYPPGRYYDIKFLIYDLDKKNIEKFRLEPSNLTNSLNYVNKGGFTFDKDSNKILSYSLNESTNTYEIKIYNIEDKKLEKTINFPKTYASNLKEGFFLHNNKIVYSDNRDGKDNYDIFLYDLTNNKETQITNTADSLEKEPSIYDNIIVYKRFEPNQDSSLMKLVIFDISSNKETQIISDDCLYRNPQIYKKNIIWGSVTNCFSMFPDDAIALIQIK